MTHKIAHPELLAEIEAACAEIEMSVSEFGLLALRDPAYVNNLRRGRECKMRTLRRVKAFMAKLEKMGKAA